MTARLAGCPPQQGGTAAVRHAGRSPGELFPARTVLRSQCSQRNCSQCALFSARTVLCATVPVAQLFPARTIPVANGSQRRGAFPRPVPGANGLAGNGCHSRTVPPASRSSLRRFLTRTAPGADCSPRAVFSAQLFSARTVLSAHCSRRNCSRRALGRLHAVPLANPVPHQRFLPPPAPRARGDPQLLFAKSA